ncbi:S24 family peptidase [Bosea vestrisii]|jgi:phage repressor protein C with HTH and peptisase S24 domain|uniref:Helix-turn-helix transcriptional regulator n=1 Tax=Bosea vestrisii TaxID=151416 RepID=A0ABW0H906_9HYPH
MDDQELDEGFKERFEALLARFPSMKMAADIAGYSAEQLAKWRDGKARAPLRPIANLCQASATSLDWLVFNREMPSSTIVTATDGELPDVVWIPLLEVIASAGPGYENARPYELRRLPFPRTWLQRLGVPEKYARFLGVDGDSMEPTIMDGWIVLVDTRPKHARANGIYVLVDGPNVRVKRIALGWQNSIVLISDNERYQSEPLSPPDAEALQVAGRIVWAGGEI